MGRLIALIVKEMLVVLQDPRSRIVLILPPVVQFFLFSFAATQEVTNQRVLVWNRDAGKWGAELIQRFRPPTFVDLIAVADTDELRARIDRREALMGLLIDQDFSRDIAAGRPARVLLVLDGRRSSSAQILNGYAQQVVAGFNADLARRSGQPPSGPRVIARAWFNPNLEFRWFTVPSVIGLMTTVTALLLTALSVARERELGTFDQLLVSPLTPGAILVGKTVPPLLFGMIQGAVLVAFSQIFFTVPLHGSLVLLFGAMALFLISVVGIGLFLSALCRTQQQAVLGAFAFLAPAILLSGFASPVQSMPRLLQWLTEANPIQHFLVILRGVFLKDASVGALADSLWPMAVIAAVTLTVATWFFRHKLN